MKLPALIRLLRPHQWSKNVFVLAPLGFAWGDRGLSLARDLTDVWHVLFAFASFSLGASAIYVVNDAVDVEKDRVHPEKRRRPIASGEVSIPVALVAAAVCALASVGLGWLSVGGGTGVVFVVLSYMVMNLAYSLKLKHVVLLDAFCIAAGFLLRVVAGGLAARADVSHWLLLCTFFLALFLALNKRRAEIDTLGEDKKNHRRILDEYPIAFLDQMVTVFAAVTIVCYTMYTVDAETLSKFAHGDRMVWSVPFVVFGIGRYTLLVQSGKGGGSPTRVFLGGDGLFLLNTIGWLIVMAAAVWS
jgi:4-hydroxybenzoate polyprenyltransferase